MIPSNAQLRLSAWRVRKFVQTDDTEKEDDDDDDKLGFIEKMFKICKFLTKILHLSYFKIGSSTQVGLMGILGDGKGIFG